jgi:ATP-dependent Clp protease ATP-binding subunit ClpC
MEKKDEIKNIDCLKCSNTGLGKYGLACSACSGIGMGMIKKHIFYYWGPKLDYASIELRKINKNFNNFVNFIAFLVGFFGFFSLGFWIYSIRETFGNSGGLIFWEAKSPFLLFFWISLLVDMFVLYRLSEEARSANKILKKEKTFIVSDDINTWKQVLALSGRMKIDVSRGFDDKAYALVTNAFKLAGEIGSPEMTIMHLAFAILADRQIAAIFSRLDVDPVALGNKIKNQIAKNRAVSYRTIMSGKIKEALIMAYIDAAEQGMDKVEPMNLIIPLIKLDAIFREIIYDFEIDEDKIANVIKWFLVDKILINNYRRYRGIARFKPEGNMDRAYTAVATPILDQFSYDMTAAAKRGRLEICIGRNDEIEHIFSSFEAGKNGVLLVGAPGVGKKTIVGGVAQMMVTEDVPEFLRDKRLLELDIGGLVSGGSASESEEKMMLAISELNRAGNIILHINDIQKMMGISAGGEESLELSDVLANSLEHGALFCIASVTSENYHKYIEGKPLDNAMAKIEISEPIGNNAIQIVESKISLLEGKHKIYFSYTAIEEAVRLSQKYIHDKYLPEKAIEILNLLAVDVVKKKGEQSMVLSEDVARALSELTKIPVSKLSMEENQMLLNLENLIHERMVDQEEAVSMVASSLRRARANLREGKRPIANLLFLGPTGVGKTELAKTVAEIYFGNEDYFIRIDMSEYQNASSVEKMIGSPDGSLGYLTEKVRRSPFSLVLLDEFEKAHPDILNLFLQVMDDGRLTDGLGRTIDFTNSIIIATSNAGAQYIQEEIRAKTSIEKIKDALINEHLNKTMRPELVNRFDGIVVFKPLSISDVEAITKLMLKKTKKLLDDKGINFKIQDEAIKILARLGYDPEFGARPLRRLLQNTIDNNIANKILAGEIRRRDTIVINNKAEIEIVKGMAL